MSRYQPLADFLESHKASRWDATFADIERQLGFPLPKSAHKYPAWWANQKGAGHSQTQGWRSVGWRTCQVDLEGRRIRFERDAGVAVVRSDRPDIANDRDGLIAKAQELTGIVDYAILIREALKALVAREAAHRLANLGGTMPDFTAPARERPIS